MSGGQKFFAALLGGSLIGLAGGIRYLLNGRILGISGIVGGLVRKEQGTAWRATFSSGLLLGGLILRSHLPDAYYELPQDFPVSRMLVGGLMVGAGVTMGSGCTSGHGVMGLSRLSVRSLAYVCTFMASGAITATLLGSGAAVTNTANPERSYPEVLKFGAQALVGTLLASLSILMHGKVFKNATVQTLLTHAVEILTATAFAVGLGVSGMTSSKNIASFLDLSQFDPALMLVMGGAIGVALPIIQLMVMPRIHKEKLPLVAKGQYTHITNSTIDAKLLTGGILFGMGWATTGMCPGPGIVNLMTPVGLLPILYYNAAMVAGMIAAPPAMKAIGW